VVSSSDVGRFGAGRRLLGGADADETFRAVECLGCDGVGGFGAEPGGPAIEKPGRAGEAGGVVRPSDGIAGDLAEDGVGESSSGSFAGALDKFDAFVDGGVGGDTVEPAELVDGDTEGGEDLGIELSRWAAGEGLYEEIDGGAVAKDSEGDFLGESRVTRG